MLVRKRFFFAVFINAILLQSLNSWAIGPGYGQALHQWHESQRQAVSEANAREKSRSFLNHCPKGFAMARPGDAGWAKHWLSGTDQACSMALVGRHDDKETKFSNSRFKDNSEFEKHLQELTGFSPGSESFLMDCFPDWQQSEKDTPEQLTSKRLLMVDYYYTVSRLQSCANKAVEGIAMLDRRIKDSGALPLEGIDVRRGVLPGVFEKKSSLVSDNACKAEGVDLVAKDAKHLRGALQAIDGEEDYLRNVTGPEAQKEFVSAAMQQGVSREDAEAVFLEMKMSEFSMEGDSTYALKAGAIKDLPLSSKTDLFKSLFREGRDTDEQLRKENGTFQFRGTYNGPLQTYTQHDFSTLKGYVHLAPEAKDLESEDFLQKLKMNLREDYAVRKEALTSELNQCMEAAECVQENSNKEKCRKKILKALVHAPESDELAFEQRQFLERQQPMLLDGHGNVKLDKEGYPQPDKMSPEYWGDEKFDKSFETVNLINATTCREGYSRTVDEADLLLKTTAIDIGIAVGTMGLGTLATGVKVATLPRLLGSAVNFVGWTAKLPFKAVKGAAGATKLGAKLVYQLAKGGASLASKSAEVRQVLSTGTKVERLANLRSLVKASAEVKSLTRLGNYSQDIITSGLRTGAGRSRALAGYYATQVADIGWAGYYIGTQGAPECIEKLNAQTEGMEIGADGKPENMCEAEWVHQLSVIEGSYLSCSVNVGMGLVMAATAKPVLNELGDAVRGRGSFARSVRDAGGDMKIFAKENPTEYVKQIAEEARLWQVKNLRNSWRGSTAVREIIAKTGKNSDEIEDLLQAGAKEFVDDVVKMVEHTGKSMDNELIGQLMVFAKENPALIMKGSSRYGKMTSQHDRIKTLGDWSKTLDSVRELKKGKGFSERASSPELRKAVKPNEGFNTAVGELALNGKFARLQKIRDTVNEMTTSHEAAQKYLSRLLSQMQLLKQSGKVTAESEIQDLQSRIGYLSDFLATQQSPNTLSARAINLYMQDFSEQVRDGLARNYFSQVYP